MTHGMKIKPSPHPLVTQPYLLPFLTLWLLLFLGFPSLLSVLLLCSLTLLHYRGSPVITLMHPAFSKRHSDFERY